jgi:hypothetical protein
MCIPYTSYTYHTQCQEKEDRGFRNPGIQALRDSGVSYVWVRLEVTGKNI